MTGIDERAARGLRAALTRPLTQTVRRSRRPLTRHQLGGTGAARLARAWSLSALAALTLTACADGAEPPSELLVPDVAWADGAPSGELEDSPWVQAVRNAELLSSVAWNNLDYSDPALIHAWGYDSVAEDLFPDAEWRMQGVPTHIIAVPDSHRLIDVGPLPLMPLSVDEGPDGASVTACVGAQKTKFRGDFQTATIEYYHVEETGAGSYSITRESPSLDMKNARRDECTLDVLPLGPDRLPGGLFDPAPAPPTDPEVQLKPPAAPEAYGLAPREQD